MMLPCRQGKLYRLGKRANVDIKAAAAGGTVTRLGAEETNATNAPFVVTTGDEIIGPRCSGTS